MAHPRPLFCLDPDDTAAFFEDDDEPIPVVGGEPTPMSSRPTTPGKSQIRAFDQSLESRHEDQWSRSPNVTGTGAIHVKSFHCKLSSESLDYLDRQVNEWLDSHPQYEVKLVSTSIGEWTSKIKEPHLIVQVWV